MRGWLNRKIFCLTKFANFKQISIASSFLSLLLLKTPSLLHCKERSGEAGDEGCSCCSAWFSPLLCWCLYPHCSCHSKELIWDQALVQWSWVPAFHLSGCFQRDIPPRGFLSSINLPFGSPIQFTVGCLCN